MQIITKQCAFILWALKNVTMGCETMCKESHFQIKLPTSLGYIPRAHKMNAQTGVMLCGSTIYIFAMIVNIQRLLVVSVL